MIMDAFLNNQYLNKILDYRGGQLYWKVRKANTIQIGDRAGRQHPDGYRYVMINNKHYAEHRIIWIMHNGPIPADIDIDHRDRIKNNNLIANLRLANTSQNLYNIGLYKSNTSGYKGVTYRADINKWRVRIGINGNRITLGHFDTAELGYEAYKMAAKELQGEFANI